jgi:hypothetical protein
MVRRSRAHCTVTIDYSTTSVYVFYSHRLGRFGYNISRGFSTQMFFYLAMRVCSCVASLVKGISVMHRQLSRLHLDLKVGSDSCTYNP